MAENIQQLSLEAVSATEETSKWIPYWDEQYKRYYWSDGNESVKVIL
jgi:hypothetical protein